MGNKDIRVRVRGPTGQSTITLDESATIDEFRTQIRNQTGLNSYDAKYGYPALQPLLLDHYPPHQKLVDLDINLNGEQLIVQPKQQPTAVTTTTAGGSNPPVSPSVNTISTQSQSPPAPSSSSSPFNNRATALTKGARFTSPSSRSAPRRATAAENDPPEVACPEQSGTLVLRIMPDDNSCLFRAVGGAVVGGLDAMSELRAIVARTIQQRPDIYSAVVLEKSPEDYAHWIQTAAAWGGAIELSILSKHFDIEICSIDVQTLRVDRFNEGRPTRCILVYSGIHYDMIALSPSDPPFTHADVPPEFDTKIFDAADAGLLQRAVELCAMLQARHYYTDTAGFRIRCNTCGGLFLGEKEVTRHAAQSGHYDFGEAS
jgi:ubiquitin thioesterase OTU1